MEHNTSPSSAAHLSSSFMQGVSNGAAPDMAAIDRLCRMALQDDKEATRLFYKKIIEPLCDSFSAKGVAVANQVLLRLIDLLRRNPQGAELDALLNHLGYFSEQQFLHRYRQLARQGQPVSLPLSALRRILVLSRVTVGADVAITSVLVHRLLTACPKAEIVLFGPYHLNEIFANIPRVRALPIVYHKECGLAQRLSYYPELFRQLEMECRQVEDIHCLLIDPDSRLSQLGLLPMVDQAPTRYFPSRALGRASGSRISELAEGWINTILGCEGRQLPRVSLPVDARKTAARFFTNRPERERTVIINFGVGNEFKKRLPDPFEEELLLRLLRQREVRIVLDSGCHPEELQRAERLASVVEAQGYTVSRTRHGGFNTLPDDFRYGVLRIQCGIGLLAALIEKADLFFGYDSCGQHLATALGKNAVICFAGATNNRFFHRWRPVDAEVTTAILRVDRPNSLSIPELRELAQRCAELMIARLVA